MGLKPILKILIALICLIFSGVNIGYAGWQGPAVIVDANWGGAAGSLGFKSASIKDKFPEEFLVLDNGKLVIDDWVNNRLSVFDENGKHFTDIFDVYFDIDQIDGDKLAGFYFDSVNRKDHIGVYLIIEKVWEWIDSGRIYESKDSDVFVSKSYVYIWNSSDGKTYKYSSTGAMMASYDQMPLEFGVKISQPRPDGRQDTTVQYDDNTYHMVLDGDWDTFFRDQNDFLYFYITYTAMDPVSGQDSMTSYVVKYDLCGQKVGELNLPVSEYEPPTQEDLDMPTTTLRVRNEYGSPVIGPDGSVYCWKRTPETYSILKWTWVDSPDDPQPGPDAPANLTVQQSIDGLYLNWATSPQDPGCVDGYEVERSTTTDGIFTPVTKTDPGVLKFNDTTALPGITYFYKVRAKSGGYYSPYTAEVSGTR